MNKITSDDIERLRKSAKQADPYGGEVLVAVPQDKCIALLDMAEQQLSPFQQRVQPWMLACFGPMIAGDRKERNHRFLEEALELVQSTGCTASEAHQLVDYVYGRPVGEPAQEVGGVMVTLAALCLANGLDMHQCGETELARIWTKVDQIRAKQAAKPKHSPLPAHVVAPPAAADDAFAAFCDREGYPSDGPFDTALRNAFDAGRAAHPPADAAPDCAVSEFSSRMCEECTKGCNTVHAAPVDAKPVIKQEMREISAQTRAELQRIFDAPSNPVEAAFKEATLANGSQPNEWEDSIPPMVWYGWCEFQKGYKAQPSTAQGEALSQEAGGIKTWQERKAAFNADGADWYDDEQYRDQEITELRAALAQRAASQPIYFGFSDEQAAIEAANKLSMIGVPLNESGALNLCHAFLKLRKPDSERDAARCIAAADRKYPIPTQEGPHVVAMLDRRIAFRHGWESAMAAQQGEKGGA